MTRSLVILALLCVACGYEDSRAISQKIIVRAFPADFGSNHVYLYGRTEQGYAKPFTIDQETQITSTSITVEFKGIVDTGSVLTNAPPASCTIDLGNLAFKTYDVEFINGDHRDFGKLEVRDIGVLLTIMNPMGVSVEEPSMIY